MAECSLSAVMKVDGVVAPTRSHTFPNPQFFFRDPMILSEEATEWQLSR